VAAFGLQAGLNNGWNDDPMVALGDEDANMVNAEDMAVDNDEQFPEESQPQSDDFYATPKPPRQQLRRRYVHDSDDQPQQPESPRLRPEGCITYSTYQIFTQVFIYRY
jgi:hypothetical protein